MKILAIGDLHGDRGLAKKLSIQADEEKVDLVILAGDLTLAEMSTKGLIKPFIEKNQEVLIIPGNHESIATADFLAEMYSNTKNIHGYSISKKDLGIFGCGGADFGATNLSEKEFFDTLKKAHEGIKSQKKKIMVTHMPPFGSKSEFTGFTGSKGIRKAIKEFSPDIAICAHIHEAGGLSETIGKTKVINVARTPTIFEI
jgi:hypothetical protein